jgi:hypothetical protein
MSNRLYPMTKLKLLLASCFLLLSTQLCAEDTTPKPGLKCVFFAPLVPYKNESPLAGMHDRLPAIAKKAGVSGHSQVALTLDPDENKRAAQIKAALSGERVDLLALPFRERSWAVERSLSKSWIKPWRPIPRCNS